MFCFLTKVTLLFSHDVSPDNAVHYERGQHTAQLVECD